MNQTDQRKLHNFANDMVMNTAVYNVLLSTFLKPVKGDVQILAASRVAIDLLNEAWKEVEKFKNITNPAAADTANIGL